MTAHSGPESRARGAFYSAAVPAFMAADSATIVGQLTSAQGQAFADVRASQVEAWEQEVALLRAALGSLGVAAADWYVLLEHQLHRLRKRLDAVLLMPGVVTVIEFKIGSVQHQAADRRQAEDYALSLRDFHEYSQSRVIVPVLCSSAAMGMSGANAVVDGVADLCVTGGDQLGEALERAAACAADASTLMSAAAFASSAYRPTPDIISAATSLYAGHTVADIGRGGAADETLTAAATALKQIVKDARDSKQHVVCFVTGAPGAGKTLLGLDLAISRQDGDAPAALLSGNRPLVHVLTESLAEDAARRGGTTKGLERHRVGAVIQNLTDYLREHVEGKAPPPEHVLVFDEAQRAWDAATGLRIMKRHTAEPHMFLEILSQLEWCCLVCLVGPGQEINRGEGGLPLWGQAVTELSLGHADWQVWSAKEALDGRGGLRGLELDAGWQQENWHEQPALDLGEPVRHHRNALYGDWVAALLRDDLTAAQGLAEKMSAPPVLVTRSLADAKTWLRRHARGGRTVGLLASAGAVRLVGDGVPPAPISRDLDAIGHWFLKPPNDFRSGSALETPLSEYGCQGLEVDYAGVCWGNDLVWSGSWMPRKMTAPRWHVIRGDEERAFRRNSYRVLLTRARAGTVVYVPVGDLGDQSRLPDDFDGIAAALTTAGAAPLVASAS